MDPDFVNVYIETLIKNLHDYTSKNVVLETKLTYSERISRELKEQKEALETRNGELLEDIERVTNEREIVRTELSSIRNIVDSTNVELERYKNIAKEVEALREVNESLTTDMEIQQAEVERLNEELKKLKSPPPPPVSKKQTKEVAAKSLEDFQ